MIRFAVCLLFAGSALAQNATESKPPEKEKPQERPRLNLRLDNPSSFAREAPAEKVAPKALPGLGADARKLPPGALPVPRDANPGDFQQ